MTSTIRRPDQATGAGSRTAVRTACLQRLATALSGYHDLDVTVRADSPGPSLAARNTAIPTMSETIAVTQAGDEVAFAWSWGELIADASNPDGAAQAIAYVLHARDAKLEVPRA